MIDFAVAHLHSHFDYKDPQFDYGQPLTSADICCIINSYNNHDTAK